MSETEPGPNADAAQAAGDAAQSGPQSASAGDAAKAASAEPEHLTTADIEKLLEDASSSLESAAGSTPPAAEAAQPFTLGDLTDEGGDGDAQNIDLLGEVELDLRIELGRTQMKLEEVLQLRSGSVVALDKLAGDPVDIFVNGRLIARGEVLVMNDSFCVRVTELVSS